MTIFLYDYYGSCATDVSSRKEKWMAKIDGLKQDCSNLIANAMVWRQSYAEPLEYSTGKPSIN